jgi:excisionase family DNA binding protein
MSFPPAKDVLDVQAAARILGVHVSCIYRLITSKRLRAWRVGGRYKLSKSDVLAQISCTLSEPKEEVSERKEAPSHADAVVQLARNGYLK